MKILGRLVKTKLNLGIKCNQPSQFVEHHLEPNLCHINKNLGVILIKNIRPLHYDEKLGYHSSLKPMD